MNLIAHLITKDIRRLWILLSIWGILLLSQVALIFASQASMTQHIAWQVAFTISGILIPLFQGLILMVLVPLLVQQEALVGTTAYWMSRPISPTMLLKAKGVFIGFFLVALPLGIELIMMALNEVTPHHLALATPEIILQAVAAVMSAAALASITSNYGKYILWLVILMGCGILFGGIFTVLNLFSDDGAFSVMSQYKLQSERIIVGQILTSVLGITMVVHQYITRNTKRSIAMLCIFWVLVTLAQTLWPWQFLSKNDLSNSTTKIVPAEGIQVSISRLYTHDAPSFRPGEQKHKNVQLHLEVKSENADMISISTEEAKWDYPNGSSIALKGEDNYNFNHSLGMSFLKNIKNQFPEYKIFGEFSNGYECLTLKNLTQADFQKFSEIPGKLSARLTFKHHSNEISAKLPLKEGAFTRIQSENLRISEILKLPTGVEVLLRKRNVNLLFEGSRFSQMPGIKSNIAHYCLINSTTKEIIFNDDERNFDASLAMLTSQMRLQSTPLRLTFTKYRGASDFPILDDAWIQNAELIRFESVEKGRSEFDFVQDGIKLSGDTPSSSPTTASDSTTGADKFLKIYHSIKEAEQYEKENKIPMAISIYQNAEQGLEDLKKSEPGWEPVIVNFRLKHVKQKLALLNAMSPKPPKPVLPEPRTSD